MEFERKCMNHYNQGVSDNSSAVELFHLHPENLWLKFWCQTDWAIQMTKHASSYRIFPFLLTKQIHFTCPHLYLDVTDPNAQSQPPLVPPDTSLLCFPVSSESFLHLCLFLLCPGLPHVTCCLQALWPALGSHRHPCGAPQVARAVALARPVVEVAVWISGLSWDCATAAACCLIQLGLHSPVPTAFHIPPGPSTSQPYMAKSVETQD